MLFDIKDVENSHDGRGSIISALISDNDKLSKEELIFLVFLIPSVTLRVDQYFKFSPPDCRICQTLALAVNDAIV